MDPSLLGMLLATELTTAPPPSLALLPSDGPPVVLLISDDEWNNHDQVAGFGARIFVFKTVVADDGKDVAAGWQAAVVNLKFADWRSLPFKSWTCPTRVEVPLRTKSNGPLDPQEAARITAKVTTEAARTVMESRDSWPVAELYCLKFREETLNIFRSKYPWVGSRVQKA